VYIAAPDKLPYISWHGFENRKVTIIKVAGCKVRGIDVPCAVWFLGFRIANLNGKYLFCASQPLMRAVIGPCGFLLLT
jgi:hypothetical protein